MRLSRHMAGILVAVCDGPIAANNFVRTALAVLASAGIVNVIDSQVSITTSGVHLLPEAFRLIGTHEVRLTRKASREVRSEGEDRSALYRP